MKLYIFKSYWSESRWRVAFHDGLEFYCEDNRWRYKRQPGGFEYTWPEKCIRYVFNALTDEQLRDDALVTYDVEHPADRDILLCHRRIRYGRDEQPKGEAARLLEEMEGDSMGVKYQAILKLLLRREAEREAAREGGDE